jgi:phosphohistidine phosphatase
MKRIIFVRHGQAEEGMAGMNDFERSLTHKGKDVSRQMALKLKEKVRDPGLLITSPAFRAFETAMIFAGVCGIPCEKVILRDKLYLNINAGSLMDILMLAGEDIDTVTLFGHNPTFTDLANYFSTEPLESLAKSAIASLTFETRTWSGIKPDSGKCELFLKPKKTL